MKPKTYEILSDCIERGIESGLRRSVKHNPEPDKHHQIECIHDLIMLEIHQYFDFDTTADREQLVADDE